MFENIGHNMTVISYRHHCLTEIVIFSWKEIHLKIATAKWLPFCLDLMWLIIYKKWRSHDGVIKWKHFPRYWHFVRGIHRSSVDSPHKGQWRGALMLSLISAWTITWANNRDAGDLRYLLYFVFVSLSHENLYYRMLFYKATLSTIWILSTPTLKRKVRQDDCPVVSFTKEVNPRLAKYLLKTNVT